MYDINPKPILTLQRNDTNSFNDCRNVHYICVSFNKIKNRPIGYYIFFRKIYGWESRFLSFNYCKLQLRKCCSTHVPHVC